MKPPEGMSRGVWGQHEVEPRRAVTAAVILGAAIRAGGEDAAATLAALGLERVGVVAADPHGLPFALWDDVEVPWNAELYVFGEATDA